jgi:uncharacterized protein (DUF1919 family)
MFKVIIWGTGSYYSQYLNLIKNQEKMGRIHVVACISNDDYINNIDTYPMVSKQNIKDIEFDYCIVAMKNFQEAIKESKSLGIAEECLIPVRVFSVPFFDFEDYINIKNSNISIISRNCWGGICYNYLGLKFQSPFINMFVNDSSFNKLLENLKYYLALPLEFEKMLYDYNLKRDYPVGRLGDILLNFNHYTDFEVAKVCWDRRKQRINYDDLLIVSSTVSQEVAIHFDKLAYDNKIIFVPFANNLSSNIFIPYEDKQDGTTIGMVSNRTANGQLNYLNLFSLMLHKKDYIRIG